MLIDVNIIRDIQNDISQKIISGLREQDWSSRVKSFFLPAANEVTLDVFNYKYESMVGGNSNHGVFVFYPDKLEKLRILTCTQDGIVRMFDSNLLLMPWRMNNLGASIESIAHFYITEDNQLDASMSNFIAIGTVDHKLFLFDWYGNPYWTDSTSGEVYGLKFASFNKNLYLLTCGANGYRGELRVYNLGARLKPDCTRKEYFSVDYDKTLWSIAIDEAGKKIYLGATDALYIVDTYQLINDRANLITNKSEYLDNKDLLIGEIRSLALSDLNGDGKNEIIAGTTLKGILFFKPLENNALEILIELNTNGWIRRLCVYKVTGGYRIVGCTDTGIVYIYLVRVIENKLEYTMEWIFKTHREVREVFSVNATNSTSNIDILVIVSRYGGVCGKIILNPMKL